MLEYIIDGGLKIMLPLMGLSVLALAVIIDRVRALRLAAADTATLRARVTECLEVEDLVGAAKACEEFKGPVAAVLLVGINKFSRLKARNRSLTEIEASVTKTMDEYAPHVIQALEKRLNLLILVASVSPLLGMTGTVTGMIRSFNVMAAAGGLDAGAVAGGISEALITTAAGLIIAIPAVVFHSILTKKVEEFVLDIEESANELMDFITLGREG